MPPNTTKRAPRAPRQALDDQVAGDELDDPERIPPAKKRGRGRPPFRPTAKDRRSVLELAGFGLRHEEIVRLVINPTTGRPIDEKTLRQHFADELERGTARVNADVAQSLYRRATSTKGSQAVTAAIFWLKCRAGWRERVDVAVEITSGVLVAPGAISVQDWIASAAAANARATQPGSSAAQVAEKGKPAAPARSS